VIGIIDADLITRKKHRFPNLASMKISGYYKAQGHDTRLIMSYGEDLAAYEKIYISKVFTNTEIPEDVLRLETVTCGGTGFYFNKAPALPAEIEHARPDYSLYDGFVEKLRAAGSKLTYICSPCRGDYEKNIIKAQEYCREALLEGLLPIAPHVYFTQFVDDEKPEERERGLLCGLQLLRYCQLIRVYGCRVSAGMYNEIQLAGVLGIEIEVYGPPEFVERVKEIYNNAAVTQKPPILRKKGRPAGVSAGSPAATILINEQDINPAAGAAFHAVNIEELNLSDEQREKVQKELELQLKATETLVNLFMGGA
jgi:hypothetical protein